MSNGYNPMRHDCVKSGCFNKKYRPKIEVFADLLPGKMAFGDIDGIVEINGNFLLLEWKSVSKEIPRGQAIMYKRMTKGFPFTIIIIYGNAETMRVYETTIIYDGCFYDTQSCDLDGLRQIISQWVQHVI